MVRGSLVSGVTTKYCARKGPGGVGCCLVKEGPWALCIVWNAPHVDAANSRSRELFSVQERGTIGLHPTHNKDSRIRYPICPRKKVGMPLPLSP